MSSDDSDISNGSSSSGQSDHRPWRPRPGWDRDSHEREHGREHGREHPFISFRHMVDRKLAQVLQMLGEQTGSAAQHEGRQAPDETASRLMGIFEQPPLYGRAMSRRAREQSEEYDREEPESAEDPLNPLYRLLDHFQRGDVDSYQLWKATSPYSPDWLKQDGEVPQRIRESCHAMFNDLMSLHNGEAMQGRAVLATRHGRSSDAAVYKRLRPSHHIESQEQFARSVDKKGDQWLSPFCLDDNWMGFGAMSRIPSLLGMLGFPRNDSTAEAQVAEERDQDDNAVSEEDLYRRFLGIGGSQREEEESPGHGEERHLEWQTNEIESSRRAQQIDEAAAKSRIIATVTQSYTTTNPDGSTRTVRRFKKTFADGSEESNEDISETPPRTQTRDLQSSQTTAVSNDSSRKRSSGWFWS